MNDREYCEVLRIETATLNIWIEQRWIIPQTSGDTAVYHDADIARGRLILDLIQSMNVNDDGIDVIMQLIDQVHGLRDRLQDLMVAIKDQDEDIKQRIVDVLNRPRHSGS